MKILAIESSCDETAAAVVEDGTKILGMAVATSATMHEKYGGIVPEVAAREQLKCIIPVIKEALTISHNNSSSHDNKKNSSIIRIIELFDDIDAIAVTVGPGLIGSLLVGVETAKTIAYKTGKPIIPVNHVLAHMYANFLESSPKNSPRVLSANPERSRREVEGSRDNIKKIEFPAISLVVSGGHTELFLMTNEKELKWLGGTLDDAAGEAFDKTARLLGFGSKGGVAIQDAAQKVKSQKAKGKIFLPRPLMRDETLNFSFSGLKTAISRVWKSYPQHTESLVNALAYEVQESITDVLVAKTLRAAKLYSARSILISGGVAANLRLRDKFQSTMNDERLTMRFFVPPVSLCTDNAAYIAAYAFFRGKPVDWHEITAVPDLSVETVE